MQAAFCRTLPENRTTWNFVESLGEEVQDLTSGKQLRSSLAESRRMKMPSTR